MALLVFRYFTKLTNLLIFTNTEFGRNMEWKG